MITVLDEHSILRKASISHALELIDAGHIKESESWSGPSSEVADAYIKENGWDRFADWFLGLREYEDPDTKSRFSYPFTDDFRNISINGLKAIRSRAGETGETEILDEAGELLAKADRRETEEPDGDRITFFAGSPRSKYGTHSSKGFKGGASGYRRAWKIHFSQIGGGATTAAAGGPIRGTVRRVSMIAAVMKPKCALPDTEKVGPRTGPKSPLPGDFPETPGDYGLSRWAKPGDDDLKQEDTRMTCNDLEVIKRAALAEIKRRANDREEASDPTNGTRLTFQMNGDSVDREGGTIQGVSIIEQGEARGHRMMVSDRTLDSVLTLLEGKVLPAYISHNGAQTDRLMEEIGSFADFYRDEDKIRARRFEALPSFRSHEPERFDRLFDLADRMPSTFGISIVFEGGLYWETDEDDVPFEGLSERPDGASYSLPTIDPTRIFSADFVDTPAATVSLFTEGNGDQLNDQNKGENMSATLAAELDESASAELERRRAAEAEEVEPKPEPKKKKSSKAKKEELAEEDEAGMPPDCAEGYVEVDGKCVAEPETEDDDEEAEPESEEASEEVTAEELSEAGAPELLTATLEEYTLRIDERDKLIADQTERIKDLTLENKIFRKALAGAEELAADGEAETSDDPEEIKQAAITNYLEANPSHNRITAILEVGKQNPQIFNHRN